MKSTILRTFVGIALVGTCFGTSVRAQSPAEVRVGLIVPLSGPFARQGETMLAGARMAAEDINNAGGVKALGGAKISLVVADTGDSIEKAKTAAQRLVAQEPNMIGATGSWISSYTLAVTEITERVGLPFLTLSLSDQIVSRGYKNVFQTSLAASKIVNLVLPDMVTLVKRASGREPKSVGVIADNTVAVAQMAKQISEQAFPKHNLKVVVDEIYTPPLADATSVVQKVRNERPGMLVLETSSVADTKLVLEKLGERGLGKGAIPIVSIGNTFGHPDLVKVVGKDQLEGLLVAVTNWNTKGQEKLNADFKRRQNAAWMSADAMSTYGDIWIFKEALEVAGAVDRRKVGDAIRTMDLTDGPASYFPGKRVKFDETGQRVGATLYVVQWQNGEPVTVYPPEFAAAPVKLLVPK